MKYLMWWMFLAFLLGVCHGCTEDYEPVVMDAEPDAEDDAAADEEEENFDSSDASDTPATETDPEDDAGTVEDGDVGAEDESEAEDEETFDATDGAEDEASDPPSWRTLCPAGTGAVFWLDPPPYWHFDCMALAGPGHGEEYANELCRGVCRNGYLRDTTHACSRYFAEPPPPEGRYRWCECDIGGEDGDMSLFYVGREYLVWHACKFGISDYFGSFMCRNFGDVECYRPVYLGDGIGGCLWYDIDHNYHPNGYCGGHPPPLPETWM